MKKETKFSIITFIVVALASYIVFSFIPNSSFEYAMSNGSVLAVFGNGMVETIGMRVIISITFALIITLLIRVVDTEETEAKKVKSKTTKKEAK